MLDFVDEAFDEVTLLVAMLIVGDRLLARSERGDHGIGADSEKVPELVVVVSLVGNDVSGGEAVDQGFRLRAVVDLAGGRDEAQRVAQSVDGDVDLGGQAAARAPDRLILNPPFPPAACWCARMIVASMIRCSRSGSSIRISKRRDHTPFWAQRRKRRKTEFQLPNSAGKSRQGAPVRHTQSTASTNRRLSLP
jgi:hypothetical protein